MNSTLAQSHYFYTSLKTLVTAGDLPSDHPLKQCPLDPFTKGTAREETQAIAALNKLAGHRWARELRCLYYGYVGSGRRKSNLHTGIVFLSMYDEELVQLLRSHPGDETLFPRVFIPDEQAEVQHYDMLRRLDLAQRMSI